MTKRIALSVLALVTALLVLAVVPLGISMTDRESDSFRGQTAATARTIAAAAEEHLSDNRPDSDAAEQISSAAARGECAQVFDAHGAEVLSTPCRAVLPPGALIRVLATGRQQSVQRAGRLTLVVPVGDTLPASGALAFSRSTDGLNERLITIWAWLGLCGSGALGASVLVAVRLARWVGRPLADLDGAAGRLGEGDLEARATVPQGPPEVRRLAATFNAMAARTENLVHGHRAVIADVSHQLRTPLTALRLRLDLLSADAEGDTAQELAGAQHEVARLSRLVDGLLAVARAENSVPRPSPVAVEEVVADRLGAWQPVAEERGVRLAARGSSGLTALLAAGDLEQVLDNLLANALEALADGGLVTIETDGDPEHRGVLLSVVDNGPGMDEAARERAFRRFDTGRPSGTGLGLAIVHRLITANGGRVALEPTPGGGLTARLHLPAGPAAARGSRRERRAPRPAPAGRRREAPRV
ncbi:HAMP domain-containing histidine kinase [Kitasatospora sp. RB6PN24]|uniref:sensor histidine kinase n=1 Tax=Kitasatospora humi TaxID=2893891 RepID=UPI001E472C78|nr:HAMP domain-containing sensor histidine kinase [Kitasatospora humi]MCC9307496.1 HAMP domain-containing histidine kinase [Kitasatospora humi]